MYECSGWGSTNAWSPRRVWIDSTEGEGSVGGGKMDLPTLVRVEFASFRALAKTTGGLSDAMIP